MKKLAVLFAALLLCLFCCACAQEPDAASSSEETGLTDAGVLSGDGEWGPVVGLD